MKKKDELAEPTSCLNKAEDDEPVFVLRAHDALAPATVRYWASMYERRIYGQGNPSAEAMEKLNSAARLANEMERWPGRKQPS